MNLVNKFNVANGSLIQSLLALMLIIFVSFSLEYPRTPKFAEIFLVGLLASRVLKHVQKKHSDHFVPKFILIVIFSTGFSFLFLSINSFVDINRRSDWIQVAITSLLCQLFLNVEKSKNNI